MTEMRRRMEEELKLRGCSSRTQKAYLEWVGRFAQHHRRAPEQMGEEQVRSYLMYLLEDRKLSRSTLVQALCALKFFYNHVLRRPCEVEDLRFPRQQKKKLPRVLSESEVRRLLKSAGNFKDQVILMTLYGSGLRLSELIHLQVKDIDSSKMQIRVRHRRSRITLSSGRRTVHGRSPEPKVPLLAYGPTRLLPSETSNQPLEDQNIRTDNLFRPMVPLSDAENWLIATWKADRDTFDNVARALCRLLLLDESALPRVRDGAVEIQMPDGWRRISDLSAGYRSVLALVVDIAIGTSGKRRKVEEAVGIVLLDEIEIHLHPLWKISIVDRLRRVFPQLSFLVTTHDPLCLKGCKIEKSWPCTGTKPAWLPSRPTSRLWTR